MQFGVTLDVFVGFQPPLKFEVTNETIQEFGLGRLLASPDIPKIVGRIDSNCIYVSEDEKVKESMSFFQIT